jgi:peptide/nickel transport system permease protein
MSIELERVRAGLRFIRRNPLLTIGLLMMLAIILFGVLGPVVVSPEYADVGAFLPKLRPSGEHVLGTDTQGRDVLATVILATPQTLKIGLLAGAVGIGVGALLGLISGYFRGTVDTVIRIVTDVFITVPGIAILVVVATNVRTMDTALLAIIVASIAWRFPARAIRAQVLSLREQTWVEVAKLNGVGGLELVVTELLPNLLPYIAAAFVTAVSGAILATIGLEALGLGPQNEFTLGMMIYWAQFYGAILRGFWWWWGPPIAMIVLIFVSLLFISAGMDEFVNTRLRRSV